VNSDRADERAIDVLLHETLDRLRRDARVRYAEVRYTDETAELARVRTSAGTGRPIESLSTTRSRGIGVRVLGRRAWGFACTPSLDPAKVAAAADRAAAIAEASSAVAFREIAFEARPAQRGSYATPVSVDPFTIPHDERLKVLDRAVRVLGEGEDGKRVRSAEAQMEWRRMHKRLLTTEGTDVRQDFINGACNMQVTAGNDAGETQTRSYPTWSGAHAFQGGYERIGALDLAGEAPRVTSEAVALLRAPSCPEGDLDLILESSQVALQVHESCGHPTELDRALGTEITLAGGSFLDPAMLGSFRYGSDAVTLTCDSIAEGGLGTFGWDDEGTPAGEHALVAHGMFVDYLSSRDTAAAIGRASTGTMRASGWDRTPLIRMTNVSLAPRSGSLDELIADTKNGIYMATDKSWSIDDQRLDFQFSCELAWEIKNGKRTRLLKNPLYAGTTPTFWASCDAICGRDEWKMWGISTCGKGDPIQVIGVGHGAAPARFRGVRIGRGT
jgi:TldD protein